QVNVQTCQACAVRHPWTFAGSNSPLDAAHPVRVMPQWPGTLRHPSPPGGWNFFSRFDGEVAAAGTKRICLPEICIHYPAVRHLRHHQPYEGYWQGLKPTGASGPQMGTRDRLYLGCEVGTE